MQKEINILELNSNLVPASKQTQYNNHLQHLRNNRDVGKAFAQESKSWKEGVTLLNSQPLKAFHLCLAAAKLALAINNKK